MISYQYTYDTAGRITEIYKNHVLIASYIYDALGQLYRENNVLENCTYLYTYDGLGNLLRKHKYTYSVGGLAEVQNEVRYSYTDAKWKDSLTKYFESYSTEITDHTQYTLTYDSLKNPLRYYNGTEYNFTWEGRTLQTATVGDTEMSFIYDQNGLRTQKTVDNNTVYRYTWNDGKLYGMTFSESGTVTATLTFFYDAEGTPYAMTCNDDVYYYIVDAQGNIPGLYGEDGLCGTYDYDAWGRIIATTGTDAAVVLNPLRYRGYIYDSETNLYYLQSRYYDPTTGRFLNADDINYLGTTGTVLSCNLFAYCENEPLMCSDFSGFVTQTYSGVVGFGIQLLFSVNVSIYQGFAGFEAIWFTKQNNFGNGIAPWCYVFLGGSFGMTLNFEELLSPNLFTNPSTILKGVGLTISCSLSLTFFLVTANRMTGPQDYLGDFNFWTGTVWGVTVSKAWGGKMSTYGVGYSMELGIKRNRISVGKKLFGSTMGWSNYRMLPITKNSLALYNSIKARV